jgi:hypothetical protein
MAKDKELDAEIVVAPVYMEAAPFPAPPVIKPETE